MLVLLVLGVLVVLVLVSDLVVKSSPLATGFCGSEVAETVEEVDPIDPLLERDSLRSRCDSVATLKQNVHEL